MAKYWSNQVRAYYDGYTIGTAMTSASAEIAVAMLDKTSVGDEAETFLTGLRADTAEFAGLYDDGTLAMSAANGLIGAGTTAPPWSLFIGTATGNIVYTVQSWLVRDAAITDVADLVRVEAGFQADGTYRRGVNLSGTGLVLIGTGNGTVLGGTHNAGAKTTAGAHAVVHMLTNTGTVQIQQRVDGTTWVNFAGLVKAAMTGPTGTVLSISSGTTVGSAIRAIFLNGTGTAVVSFVRDPD
jgi:hypothetical protein